MTDNECVSLTLNGSPMRVPANMLVSELLEQRGLPRQGVAVEINQDLVQRGDFEVRTFNDGDRVEIVSFVGGG